VIGRRGGGPPGRGRGPAGERDRGAPGPEPLGEVLARVLRGLRIEERRREGALGTAWDRAAGEGLAPRARPVSFRAGRLTVEVEGAALLQEVRGFRAEALLEALRREPGGERVREIRFVPAGRQE
jgi:hypothetical protein